MDFQGQRLSERMYQICIVMFAILGFVVGYGTGSFRAMMLTFGAGVVLAIVIAVPDWPYMVEIAMSISFAAARSPGTSSAPHEEASISSSPLLRSASHEASTAEGVPAQSRTTSYWPSVPASITFAPT